jgi:COMPASS component SWD3
MEDLATQPPLSIVKLEEKRLPKYKLKYTMGGHTMSISSLKFSPDGSSLASAGMSPYLALYVKK